MQERDIDRWADIMTAYSNERLYEEVLFWLEGTLPLLHNDTLWHLGAPQYYSTVQHFPKELEQWLHLNWSSYPHLAKWLAMNPPIDRGECKVSNVLDTCYNVLPEILSMLYHRWEESPGGHPEPLRYLEWP